MEWPITVGKSPQYGFRGVLATRDIKRGEVVERCPLILVPIEEESHLENTILSKYYFLWDKTHHAICLGYGSLYNHSTNANLKIELVKKDTVIEFIAKRDIKAGEELFHNYAGDDAPESDVLPEYVDMNKDVRT